MKQYRREQLPYEDYLLLVEHGKEHDKWHSDIAGKDFRVPRHSSKEIPKGTQNAIMRDAGLK
ncbi:toxin HicA [Hornefia porci]|uniref:Toxin HicA n=1 Tax=Hornefia porci TaxID=2652292 RepID=A0A1Q9JLQ5_9FIRM|nr:toxin HicA [Hornefia porci]